MANMSWHLLLGGFQLTQGRNRLVISVSVRRFLLETEIIEPKSGGSAFQEDKTSSAKTIKQEYALLVQETVRRIRAGM